LFAVKPAFVSLIIKNAGIIRGISEKYYKKGKKKKKRLTPRIGRVTILQFTGERWFEYMSNFLDGGIVSPLVFHAHRSRFVLSRFYFQLHGAAPQCRIVEPWSMKTAALRPLRRKTAGAGYQIGYLATGSYVKTLSEWYAGMGFHRGRFF
jgi:hypothetical protein